uniref:Uncharacterized protein n=1 Tax=Octactis speculum TaxID=3111310 RepID=A0A7S2H6Z7_9STRA|mmetsp:Transcript_61955/g.85170  ORF Transcript_61955/g.85170 Transcript_61955/m.85170 type:complete len:110 (+) Transcript_61955:125-454(+)
MLSTPVVLRTRESPFLPISFQSNDAERFPGGKSELRTPEEQERGREKCPHQILRALPGTKGGQGGRRKEVTLTVEVARHDSWCFEGLSLFIANACLEALQSSCSSKAPR